MIRRLAATSGSTFAIVLIWKVALLLFTAQPVPNNDAFFYDGPVVNFLLHGKYCNPALVHALPISGGEIFCAYPPLHQLGLLAWMRVFGTSALAAMWLHVVLLCAYFFIVLTILRRLQVSALMINLTGLFLFGITFHDRPDTLAHVLGALAILGVVKGGKGVWLGAGALVLAFCASLQIGGVYLVWCGLISLGSALAGKERFPFAAALTAISVLAGLVALVKFGFPHLWEGFQEHVRITPSVTPWRMPTLLDSLKAARTAPAIFVVAAVLGWCFLKSKLALQTLREVPAARVALCGMIAGLGLIGASLLKLSPNTIHITNYLQPIIVGSFLASGFISGRAQLPSRPILALFVGLSLLTSIRAIGMTTWGVLCARDVSYREATSRIRVEVELLPAGSTVIASSAFLYGLASRTNISWVHNDWPAPPGGRVDWEAHAFGELRPAKIILTQFDFYRRYGAILEQLKRDPQLAAMAVTNTASLLPPDAFPRFSRVVQNVSWAPVIVDLKWR